MAKLQNIEAADDAKGKLLFVTINTKEDP